MSKLQFRVLFRQFLFRMVDVELLSPAAGGDIRNLLGRFGAILVFAELWLALGVLLTPSMPLPKPERFLAVLAEEHFLIAITILAVGLFGVLSWDSMFPDRGDVLVLSPLPVRAQTLFAAKAVAAAAGLGLSVFVLNAATSVAVAIAFGRMPQIRGFLDAMALFSGLETTTPNLILGPLRMFGAYWITLISAGAFVFCSILSIQGIAQLLPRQKFLRVSAFLQIAAFLFFIAMFFTQLPFASPSDLLSPENQKLLPWLPSYWFFGMLQELNGASIFSSGPAQVTVFARRAWLGLGISLTGAVASYLICYFRTLRMIAEQPDILPARAGLHWLPKFGGAFETAITQFSIRTLARSRKHRVTLAFYLGIAFAIVLLGAKDPTAQALAKSGDWKQPNIGVLVGTVLVMCSTILGVRVAFSMPLELRANWIFRTMPVSGGAQHARATRRSLYALSLFPVWITAVVLLLWLWPWQPAAWHLMVMGLSGSVAVELCLLNFRKIPFTCSYLPGKTQLHFNMLASVYVAMALAVPALNSELDALKRSDHRLLAETLLALAAIVGALRWYSSQTAPVAETIEFEDVPVPAVMTLGLSRDGRPV